MPLSGAIAGEEHQVGRDHETAIRAVVSRFKDSPDEARLRANAVAALMGVSLATVWRRAASGAIPRGRREGGTTTWTVGQMRKVLIEGVA